MIRNLVRIENELSEIYDDLKTDQNRTRISLIQDLKWHIYNNRARRWKAIDIATDYRIEELVPDIAVQLNNPDEIIREIAVFSLIGGFKIAEYAEIGLKMAKDDPDDFVRLIACTNLGCVLPKVSDIELKTKISEYLLNNIFNPNEDDLIRKSSYECVYIALDYPPKYWFIDDIDFDKDIDKSVIKKFRKKYLARIDKV